MIDGSLKPLGYFLHGQEQTGDKTYAAMSRGCWLRRAKMLIYRVSSRYLIHSPAPGLFRRVGQFPFFCLTGKLKLLRIRWGLSSSINRSRGMNWISGTILNSCLDWHLMAHVLAASRIYERDKQMARYFRGLLQIKIRRKAVKVRFT